jgi:chromosome segregation ATPase
MNNIDIDELKNDNLKLINLNDFLNEKIYNLCLEINKNIINEELDNIKNLPEKIKSIIKELNINKEKIIKECENINIKNEKLSKDLPKVKNKIIELEEQLNKEENKNFDKKDTFLSLKHDDKLLRINKEIKNNKELIENIYHEIKELEEKDIWYVNELNIIYKNLDILNDLNINLYELNLKYIKKGFNNNFFNYFGYLIGFTGILFAIKKHF